MKMLKVFRAWLSVVFWTLLALIPAVIHDLSGDIAVPLERRSRQAEEKWEVAKRL